MRPRKPAGREAAIDMAIGPENDSASSANGSSCGSCERATRFQPRVAEVLVRRVGDDDGPDARAERVTEAGKERARSVHAGEQHQCRFRNVAPCQ